MKTTRSAIPDLAREALERGPHGPVADEDARQADLGEGAQQDVGTLAVDQRTNEQIVTVEAVPRLHALRAWCSASHLASAAFRTVVKRERGIPARTASSSASDGKLATTAVAARHARRFTWR